MTRAKLVAGFFALLLITSGPICSHFNGMETTSDMLSATVLIGLLATAYRFPPTFIYHMLETMQRHNSVCFIASSVAPIIPILLAEAAVIPDPSCAPIIPVAEADIIPEHSRSKGRVMIIEALLALFISAATLFTRTPTRVAILKPVCFYGLVALWQLLLLQHWLEAIYLAWICAVAYSASNADMALAEREDRSLWSAAVNQ